MLCGPHVASSMQAMHYKSVCASERLWLLSLKKKDLLASSSLCIFGICKL